MPINTIFLILLIIAFLYLVLYLILTLVNSLKKYISSVDLRKEKSYDSKSLGEVIKQYRINCNMTQEFVAESLGVSRQAVSKWERGASNPSTANLIAMSKLYGVSPEDILYKKEKGEKQ